MSDTGLVGKEKPCAVCGRYCIPRDDWAYKKWHGNKLLVFCSWKCLRHWEKTKMRTKGERRELIIQGIRDGLNNKEIATMLDEDIRKVAYYRKREEENNERETESEKSGSEDH